MQSRPLACSHHPEPRQSVDLGRADLRFSGPVSMTNARGEHEVQCCLERL